MRRPATLASVAAAQLAVQAVGLVTARRRRLGFDFVPFGWRGAAGTARNSLLLGTPFSAPGPMLAGQVAATAVLAAGRSPVAARILGFLGWAMIAGYLGEREVQRRLLRGEWDPVETPVAAAGLGGAVAMTVLGFATDT